jgi:hypothetical protein
LRVGAESKEAGEKDLTESGTMRGVDEAGCVLNARMRPPMSRIYMVT